MLNIIKADLYRILRGKGFYITIILLLAFIILQTSASSVGTIGVYMTYEEDMDTGTIISEDGGKLFTGMSATFEMMSVTDTLLFFILPFIIFIGSADFSAGTAKNVLANGMPRIKYYLSKLILSCIFCIAVLSLNVILPVVVGTIKNGFGGTLDIGYVGKLARPFLSQLFICIAVTCVGVFFVFATKRTAAVNGAYIAFYFVPILTLFTIVQFNSNLEFLYNYDISLNIRKLILIDLLDSADIIRAFAIGAFYIIASTIGGILLFKKSEVK
jgi:ABC-type transport system involved in multi-copper enzyme maturation permease subunit